MADLLRDGLAWLEQQRTVHMTSPVTYRRAGQGDAEVQATYGKTEFEVADDFGTRIRTHMIDFIILADDLEWEPQAGDVIVAHGQRYEVMDFAGQGPWRWSDAYRTTMRIHTKHIGADA